MASPPVSLRMLARLVAPLLAVLPLPAAAVVHDIAGSETVAWDAIVGTTAIAFDGKLENIRFTGTLAASGLQPFVVDLNNAIISGNANAIAIARAALVNAIEGVQGSGLGVLRFDSTTALDASGANDQRLLIEQEKAGSLDLRADLTLSGNIRTLGGVPPPDPNYKPVPGDSTMQEQGGALHVGVNALLAVTGTNSMAFSSNRIEGDYARGGAVFNEGSLNFAVDTSFSGNIADGYHARGGAVSNGGVLSFGERAEFDGNRAESDSSSAYGGALANTKYTDYPGAGETTFGTVSFSGPTVFKDNKASSTSSADDANGSGGAVFNQGVMVFTDSANFTGNESNSLNGRASGGALYQDGGELYFFDSVSFTGNRAVSESNDSDDFAAGGALYVSGTGDVKFAGTSTFSGNFAESTDSYARGGAILNNGTISFTGSAIFENNTASGFTISSSGYGGGAIYNSSSGMLNLTPDADKVIRFSGNQEILAGAAEANSIYLATTSAGGGTLNIGGEGTVDMRDPMRGNAANNANITINKTGDGEWKLGGTSNFTQSGSGKTTFTVGDGTLYLYAQDEVENGRNGGVQTGSIHLDGGGSSFTLKEDATLRLGGLGHEITGGTIQLAGTLQGAAGNSSLVLRTVDGVTLEANKTFTVNVASSNALLTLDAAMQGQGDLAKTGAGTLLLLNGDAYPSGYAGTTTVTGGTLRAGKQDVFSSSSTHIIGSGGTLDTNGFEQTVMGLKNSGTVLTGAPGATSQAVLKVEGGYEGDGGLIHMNVKLGGDDSPTNWLHLNTASGTSTVYVTNAGGTGAQTDKGILLIDIGGPGTDALFTLQSVFGADYVVAGAYTYRLYQGDTSGSDPNDWYLRSVPGQYHVAAPVYESYPQVLLGLNGVSTLQQRTRNRFRPEPVASLRGLHYAAAPGFSYAGSLAAAPAEGGAWARVEGARNRLEPRSSLTDTRFTQDVFKVQAGADTLLKENENGALEGGVFIQYVQGKAKTRSTRYASGEISTDGYGLGGTLTWYGKDGFYVDGQAQVMRYDSDLSTSADHAPKLKKGHDGMGYALSVETGKRMAMGAQWTMTPQAQLAYSRVDFDRFRDGFGSRIDLDQGDSLQGRLALALERESPWKNTDGSARSRVYGIANLYYEFLDGARVSIEDVRFTSEKERLWGGLGAGGSYSWGNGRYSVYGEATANTSLKHFGDSYSIQGNVGFRMRW